VTTFYFLIPTLLLHINHPLPPRIIPTRLHKHIDTPLDIVQRLRHLDTPVETGSEAHLVREPTPDTVEVVEEAHVQLTRAQVVAVV